MIQLILHLLGDYVLQSDRMAQNKTKSSFEASVTPSLIPVNHPAATVVAGIRAILQTL
jgi:hypothetical protein